jgi:hypothetical protein
MLTRNAVRLLHRMAPLEAVQNVASIAASSRRHSHARATVFAKQALIEGLPVTFAEISEAWHRIRNGEGK